MRLLGCFILCLSLCACGIEPEDRAYVTAVAFKGEGGVSLLTAEGESGEEVSEKNKGIVSGEGESIEEAIGHCNRQSPGELFFGHTTLCVVDEALLWDRDRLWELIEYVEEEREISRRTILIGARESEAVLAGEGGGKDVAEFIGEYYRSHRGEEPVELEDLCIAMREERGLDIPLLGVGEEGFKWEGTLCLN